MAGTGKRLAAPERRENLDLQAVFTEAEADRMRQGFMPRQMEDKWLICFEDGWLCFHRSWTGAFIYGLRLEPAADGVRVTESWVNRDPEQYNARNTEYDRSLVRYLIERILLGKDVAFPMPPGVGDKPAGLARHHYVGRA